MRTRNRYIFACPCYACTIAGEAVICIRFRDFLSLRHSGLLAFGGYTDEEYQHGAKVY